MQSHKAQKFQSGDLLFPVDCSFKSKETISIKFQGEATAKLPLNSLVVKSHENMCYFGIIANLKEENTWVLGKLFFFDSNRVSIYWDVLDDKLCISAPLFKIH